MYTVFVYKIKKTLNQSIYFGKVLMNIETRHYGLGDLPERVQKGCLWRRTLPLMTGGGSQLIACARNWRCWTEIDVKTWAQRILTTGLRRTSWSPRRTTSLSWYGCTWLTVMINHDYGVNGHFCNLFSLSQTNWHILIFFRTLPLDRYEDEGQPIVFRGDDPDDHLLLIILITVIILVPPDDLDDRLVVMINDIKAIR